MACLRVLVGSVSQYILPSSTLSSKYGNSWLQKPPKNQDGDDWCKPMSDIMLAPSLCNRKWAGRYEQPTENYYPCCNSTHRFSVLQLNSAAFRAKNVLRSRWRVTIGHLSDGQNPHECQHCFVLYTVYCIRCLNKQLFANMLVVTTLKWW